MADLYGVYKCEHCGNVVKVVNAGGGDLVCCGEKMVKLEAKTADSATEKHVPVIGKTDGGYTVTVGSTLHPMAEDHWIQWIELVVDGVRIRKTLNPGDEPKAFFAVETEAKELGAYEYCNKHGLWKI